MLEVRYNMNIFDATEKATVFKDGEYYGSIYTDGTVRIYKPARGNHRRIFLNARTLDRIGFLYLYGNDDRIKRLWDYIIEDTENKVVTNEGIWYDWTTRVLQYTTEDLLK